jgi:hypothetical protein
MKLDSNEKIILKKRKFLGYGVQSMFPPEKGFVLSWTYEGGTSITNKYGFVNIYLTNRRIYAELMLFHIRVLDIPLSQIKDFKKEEKGFVDSVVIKYQKNKKLKYVILSLGSDASLWFKKMKEITY